MQQNYLVEGTLFPARRIRGKSHKKIRNFSVDSEDEFPSRLKNIPSGKPNAIKFDTEPLAPISSLKFIHFKFLKGKRHSARIAKFPLERLKVQIKAICKSKVILPWDFLNSVSGAAAL